MTKKQIKDYIFINSNFKNIAEKKTWKYFEKSDYYKYIQEDNSVDNINYYCDKFMIDIRNLNLAN